MDLLITPQRLRLYPVFFVVASVLALTLSSVARIVAPTVQGAWLPDYLAHWTGARLLLTGDTWVLYDPAAQLALQDATLGGSSALAWFVSLPIVAAFYAPLAMLPYTWSGLVWFLISTTLLIWSILSLKHITPALMSRRRVAVLLAVLASPVAFELLGGGQDSAFILAVWLIGMRFAKNGHDFWAGAAFGLGFAKPQLVVLVPLTLLATRNYRALASFAAVCTLFAGISAGVVGIDGLQHWLSALSSPLYMEQVQNGQAWKMVGLPSLLQAFLPPALHPWGTPLLTWLPLPLGALILLTWIRRYRKTQGNPREIWIATLATTVVFSPHLATYDAILFVPVIVFLLERRSTPLLRVSTVAAFALLYLGPVFHLAASNISWPFSIVEAPWSALPLALIWLELRRFFETQRVLSSASIPPGREQEGFAPSKEQSSPNRQKRLDQLN
ncbi:glycosyltransferase family 87 protein [Pseudarthrobacter sp902506025]|uniref:glycosyltransferase family 87 protein n=1 Tax=Pseudarthrobacter sp. 902506025 TaxID=3155291 RepID=UPI00344BCA5E